MSLWWGARCASRFGTPEGVRLGEVVVLRAELDTNFVGYPVEEYCASRNARSAFSAPGFSDAKFRYTGGALELEARMK